MSDTDLLTTTTTSATGHHDSPLIREVIGPSATREVLENPDTVIELL